MTDLDAHRIIPTPDRDYERFALAAGYRVGNLIFLSGQVAIDEAGALLGKNEPERQIRQALANVDRLLAAAGSRLAKVVKTTTYLTNMTHVGVWLKVKSELFSKPWPAGTIVEVSRLGHPDALIEIDVVALAAGDKVG
ncbi:MAG: RidA family protein [Alphaproteobacteria bacterium]|nr:RidA family protein [Alphaproteobacteria bacterium]